MDFNLKKTTRHIISFQASIAWLNYRNNHDQIKSDLVYMIISYVLSEFWLYWKRNLVAHIHEKYQFPSQPVISRTFRITSSPQVMMVNHVSEAEIKNDFNTIKTGLLVHENATYASLQCEDMTAFKLTVNHWNLEVLQSIFLHNEIHRDYRYRVYSHRSHWNASELNDMILDPGVLEQGYI